MKIWLDEHLSPLLVPWIASRFGFEAAHVRYLNLARAHDRQIFAAARSADAILMTKDVDFVALVERLGPPPRIVWLTCGNSSNTNLKGLLDRHLKEAFDALRRGEPIVEIG